MLFLKFGCNFFAVACKKIAVACKKIAVACKKIAVASKKIAVACKKIAVACNVRETRRFGVRPTARKCALSWQILLGSLATVKLLCVPPASSPTNGRPGICSRLVLQTSYKFPTTNSYYKFPTTNSRDFTTNSTTNL